MYGQQNIKIGKYYFILNNIFGFSFAEFACGPHR